MTLHKHRDNYQMLPWIAKACGSGARATMQGARLHGCKPDSCWYTALAKLQVRGCRIGGLCISGPEPPLPHSEHPRRNQTWQLSVVLARVQLSPRLANHRYWQQPSERPSSRNGISPALLARRLPELLGQYVLHGSCGCSFAAAP